MRQNSLLLVLFLSACGGNSVRYVEVPGDAGTVIRDCADDSDCAPDTCNLATGYCTHEVERIVERTVSESCNGLDDDGDGVVDNGVWGLGSRSVVYEAGPCEVVRRLFVAWDGERYQILVGTISGTPVDQRAPGSCIGAPYTYLSFRHLTVGADGHLVSDDLVMEQVVSVVESYGYDATWTGSEFALVYQHDDPGSISRVLYIIPTDGSDPFPTYGEVNADAPGNTRGWSARVVWDGTELLLVTTDPTEDGGAYSVSVFDAQGLFQRRVPVPGITASSYYETFVIVPREDGGHLLVRQGASDEVLTVARFGSHGMPAEIVSTIPSRMSVSVRRAWVLPYGALVSVLDWGATPKTVLLDGEGIAASGLITRFGDPVFAASDDMYGFVDGFLTREPVSSDVAAVTGIARLPEEVSDVQMLVGLEDALVAFIAEGEYVAIAKVGCP